MSWYSAGVRMIAIAVSLAAVTVACAFHKLGKDLRRLESDCVIRGEIRGAAAGGAKVYVIVVRRPSPDLVEIADVATLDSSHPGFAFLLPMATDYWIAAFQDSNGDQHYESGEPGWVFGAPSPVPLGKDRTSALLDAQLSTAPQPVPKELALAFQKVRGGRALVDLRTGDGVKIVSGEIADLDAPRFSVKGGTEGLWQPVTFLVTHGVGVYFLEPYDAKRVPVLFVYGAGGSPQDFRHYFEKLDRKKFQAWFFLYPSGLRLAESSRVLGRIIDALHAKYGFARLDVVAHSMGGLVARNFLLDSKLTKNQPWPRTFVSISSPWSGHPAAALGVEYAPEVIPSWRDMAEGSPFTAQLFERTLAPPMTYCLGFTFHGRDGIGLPQDNDGAVGIPSELRPEAQNEALQMRGFDLTHTGVLRSDDAFAFIQSCLELGEAKD